jgi:hypothetical protein
MCYGQDGGQVIFCGPSQQISQHKWASLSGPGHILGSERNRAFFFLHIYFERETPPSTVDFVLEKMNKTELMVVVTS